jgi:hypothetical protein
MLTPSTWGKCCTSASRGKLYFPFIGYSDFFGLNEDDTGVRELLVDGDMVYTALFKGQNASWWEWSSGSALFFWRWHPTQRKAARDGMEIFIQACLPSKTTKGRATQQDKVSAMGKQLCKLVHCGYVLGGAVNSTIDFFYMGKGDDIHIVYNGTSCGLNDALFAPGLFLPKAGSASQTPMFYSWMCDGDMGEMFPNFPTRIHSRSGIDVAQFQAFLLNLSARQECSCSRLLPCFGRGCVCV